MNEIDLFRTGRKPHKPTVKEAILNDICNFDIFISTEYADPVPVYCNLEFGQIRETLNGQTFEIGISFAILRMAASGYIIHSDNKYGQISENNTVRLDVANSTSSEKTNEISSSLKSNLIGNFAKKKGTKSSENSNISASFNHQYVTAIANNCWTIRSPDRVNKILGGSIILSKILCSMSPAGTSNQKMVGGRIEVPPGTLIMKPVDGQKSKLKHHKLVQTLIYKKMRESGSGYPVIDEYTPEIVISTVTIEDGDI